MILSLTRKQKGMIGSTVLIGVTLLALAVSNALNKPGQRPLSPQESHVVGLIAKEYGIAPSNIVLVSLKEDNGPGYCIYGKSPYLMTVKVKRSALTHNPLDLGYKDVRGSAYLGGGVDLTLWEKMVSIVRPSPVSSLNDYLKNGDFVTINLSGSP